MLSSNIYNNNNNMPNNISFGHQYSMDMDRKPVLSDLCSIPPQSASSVYNMSSNPPQHGLSHIIPPHMMSHKYSFTPNTQNCSIGCSHSHSYSAASVPAQIANINVMDTKLSIKPFLD